MLPNPEGNLFGFALAPLRSARPDRTGPGGTIGHLIVRPAID
jgi:hypothetical protein